VIVTPIFDFNTITITITFSEDVVEYLEKCAIVAASPYSIRREDGIFPGYFYTCKVNTSLLTILSRIVSTRQRTVFSLNDQPFIVEERDDQKNSCSNRALIEISIGRLVAIQ